ncbi:hypothetical protein [Ekhidna sp. To15]|uniref:hypothetical protein n=1 Tax=Ekhidna sp. To15 TaxID=3395267 RepID=UPI003F524AB3
MKGKLLFKEEQSFVGTWMWYLVIGITLLSVGGTAIGLMFTKDSEGIIGLVLSAIVTGGVVVLLYTSKLYVSIDQDHLYYRYPPFVNKEKKLGKADVKEIYIRKYKPITEYGGWGYRFRFRSGRAMNVAGNQGLQLLLKNDKRLLIGTQKPEKMKQAVRRLKENWGLDG